jgi:hypothetical protein
MRVLKITLFAGSLLLAQSPRGASVERAPSSRPLSLESWRGVDLLRWAESLPWRDPPGLSITYRRIGKEIHPQSVLPDNALLRPIGGCQNPGIAHCYDCRGNLLWSRSCCRDFPSECGVYEDECYQDGGAEFCVGGVQAKFGWAFSGGGVPLRSTWEGFLDYLNQQVRKLPLRTFERVWVYFSLSSAGVLAVDSVRWGESPRSAVFAGHPGEWTVSLTPLLPQERRQPCESLPMTPPRSPSSQDKPLLPSCVGEVACKQFSLQPGTAYRLTFAVVPLRKASFSESGLEVHPNPSEGRIQVRFPREKVYLMRILYVPTGKVVQELTVQGQAWEGVLPEQPGLYKVILSDGSQSWSQSVLRR